MLAILTDSKPAILTIRKLDTGAALPRSEIEARILKELCRRTHDQNDTCVAWVKGHKGIDGNEEASKLCRETSILGHESEGVVTTAGLRAWSRRVRAEVRGGSGEGILGWNRKAISAYTWWVMEKGPQRSWLHKIKKKDTQECQCGHQEQSGEHLVDRCKLLEEERGRVEKEKRVHVEGKTCAQKKGPVGPERGEEEDKLERFFSSIYEFHNPVKSTPVFVPADLPPRYAISFVPAVNVPVIPESISVPVSVPAISGLLLFLFPFLFLLLFSSLSVSFLRLLLPSSLRLILHIVCQLLSYVL